ncbi:hypothetical protein Q5752_002042 [Cryptotrichosporon argae]
MSLFAPRPVEERASVILPTVTCSSCAAPIPLNALGEHVCIPPPPTSSVPRSVPRATQLSIPAPLPAPAPARTAARPRNLDLAPRGGSGLAPRAPSPLGPAGSPRTPSPTNPFFPRGKGVPAPTADADPGLGPPASAGPSSQAGSPPGNDPMPDTTSGGGAGMAGVGRRAFAAAAWGVRAGVALAASKGYASDTGSTSPPDLYAPFPVQMPVARPSPTPREPVILPKAPLINRQRSGTSIPRVEHSRHPSVPPSPPQMVRSATAPGPPSGSAEMSRRPSAGSSSSSSSSSAAAPIGQDAKPTFFDRYKQMVSSSSAASGLLRQVSGDSGPLVRSPEQVGAALSAYDDEEESALPWATRVDEPEPIDPRQPTSSSSSSSSSSRRQGASGSGHETEVVITPSQSWEGLADTAADDARSAAGASTHSLDAFGTPYAPARARADHLEQIGEEDDEDDEGERLVFGATPVKRRSGSTAGPAARIHASSSTGTLAPAPASPPLPHARSRTIPELTQNGRPRKTCAKCARPVGGAARFVERDGVILCEADWKALYLPACRRCARPIETSAVSSSDGQLKGKWHRACFTCARCDAPFAGDDFYVLAGKPWCQYHYHEAAGTLCAAPRCRRPIEGPCVLTPAPNAQRFHPGHLACEHTAPGAQGTCTEPMDEYYEVGAGRFCERHVADAQRRHRQTGGTGGGRAEKRRTRLVDLPRGGF